MRLAVALLAVFTPILVAAAPPVPPLPNWVASWTSAQQIPEPHNALPPADMTDATLRQIVHVSLGGPRLRVRFSNAFGIAPLKIGAAHVARAATPGAPATVAGSDRALSFDGRPNVVIPAGADYWSDPIDLDVPPLSSLAVSLYLPEAPLQQTAHPGSRSTSYLVHGDRTGAADLPSAKTVEHWYNLAGIEIATPAADMSVKPRPNAAGMAIAAAPAAETIVAFGDSITDGHGATTNGDNRWPDQLARRLQANPAYHRFAVVNQGIGGNRLLLDGLGPNALARFDRDVISQPGVRWVILLEGINDLGTLTRDHPVSPADHAALVQALIAADRQMIARAHAHGIRVMGATITPDGHSDYYHPDAANEADRQAINRWIRTGKEFDAVVDFDAVVRDPAEPTRLLPLFDSGDHLHPSAQGYLVMAAAIPLNAIVR